MVHSSTAKATDKATVFKAARNFKAKEKVLLLVPGTLTWGRKTRGSIRYFGKVDGTLSDFGGGTPLAEYHRTIDDILTDREPRPKDSDLDTVKDCVNAFFTAKAIKRDDGELSPRSWSNYHATCSRIIDVLGKHRAVVDVTGDDFRTLRAAFMKGRGPIALGNEIRHARIFFNFCDEGGLIDRPVRYGQAFDLPSSHELLVQVVPPETRDQYAVGAYGRDIRQGFRRAGVPAWLPARRRHNAAMRI